MEGKAMSGTEGSFESTYGALGLPGLSNAGAVWWQAQKSIMTGWQSYADGWSQNRLEDLRTSMDLAQASFHARDPEQLAKMQKKWMTGVLERAASDLLDFANCACSAVQSGAPIPAPRESSSVRRPGAKAAKPAA
jgi:hypothetical protein